MDHDSFSTIGFSGNRKLGGFFLRGAAAAGCAFENAENVALFHDEHILIACAWTNGNDFALLGLLFDGVGDDNSPLRLFFLLKAAYNDAIMQRPKLHDISSEHSHLQKVRAGVFRSARNTEIFSPAGTVKGRVLIITHHQGTGFTPLAARASAKSGALFQLFPFVAEKS
jgi:hypothetical protein